MSTHGRWLVELLIDLAEHRPIELDSDAEKRSLRARLGDPTRRRGFDAYDERLAGAIVDRPLAEHRRLRTLSNDAERRLEGEVRLRSPLPIRTKDRKSLNLRHDRVLPRARVRIARQDLNELFVHRPRLLDEQIAGW